MWCAYVFAGIALISLPDNWHSTQTLILWISSSFLQLVLLPVIIVGQNIQAKASDKRAEDTYKDADAVLHEVTHIQKHLQAQDEQILAILDHVRSLVGPAASS
jgi:type VI protein secretion system component VasK